METRAPHTTVWRQTEGGEKTEKKNEKKVFSTRAPLGAARCREMPSLEVWCARPVRSGASQHQHQKHTRTPLDIVALALEVYVGRVRGCGGAITAKAKSSFTLKSRETVPLAAESSSDGSGAQGPAMVWARIKGDRVLCESHKLYKQFRMKQQETDHIGQDKPESHQFQLNPIESSKSPFSGFISTRSLDND